MMNRHTAKRATWVLLALWRAASFAKTEAEPRFAPGPTRIFFAAYEHFRGLELSDATPGCFVSASRFADLRALPLLLDATIAPDWERQPLHQRLADWERK